MEIFCTTSLALGWDTKGAAQVEGIQGFSSGCRWQLSNRIDNRVDLKIM